MLRDRLKQDQENAMRSKDEVRLRTLRSIRSAIQTQEIANRGGKTGEMDDDAVIAVLTKQAKQRRDSIDQFQKAGRADLVDQEKAELAIIEEYLPRQYTDAEIEGEVRALMDKLGVSDTSGMGRLMGAAMGEMRGKADGKRVQAIVRTLLGG